MKRFVWLNRMIRENGFTIGCEIGTGTGRTGCEILKANKDFQLIQVAYYPNLSGEINYCTTNRAKKLWQRRMRPFKKQLTILFLPSHIAVNQIRDGTLDFVFIDADHSYEHCIEDIKDWAPKVKSKGLISGHDFGHPDFPGVEKAVREFFGNNFGFIDDGIWYSWKTN